MLIEKIRAIYHSRRSSFSGACLLTQGGNRLFAEASGLANRGFAIKNTLDTRFDAASVTKLFTAVAVLQKKRGIWRTGYAFEFLERGGEVFCLYKK